MNSLVIAGNIIKRLTHELATLGYMILFPVFAAILAYVMFGSTNVIDVGISNIPKNDFGIVEYLQNTKEYNITIVDKNELQEKVLSEKIKIGISFPDNFKELNINSAQKIKLISLKEDETLQKLSGRINQYLSNAASPERAVIANNSQNVNSKIEQSKLSLGILTMFILMFIGTISGSLLEDKNKKTFMRNFCAPIREHEMMLGYLISNTLLGCIQIIIFLCVSTLIFKTEWGTSILNVFIVLLFFMIASIGFTVGIAGFISDQQKFNMVIMLSAVTTSFLGGEMLPVEFMNNIFQKIANFIPQKWVIDSYMKLASGKSLLDIRFNLLILLLFGLVFFTFGVKTLKPTVEDL